MIHVFIILALLSGFLATILPEYRAVLAVIGLAMAIGAASIPIFADDKDE